MGHKKFRFRAVRKYRGVRIAGVTAQQRVGMESRGGDRRGMVGGGDSREYGGAITLSLPEGSMMTWGVRIMANG